MPIRKRQRRPARRVAETEDDMPRLPRPWRERRRPTRRPRSSPDGCGIRRHVDKCFPAIRPGDGICPIRDSATVPAGFCPELVRTDQEEQVPLPYGTSNGCGRLGAVSYARRAHKRAAGGLARHQRLGSLYRPRWPLSGQLARYKVAISPRRRGRSPGRDR